MTYTPMHITHIDDVLPALEGRTDFVVAQRDGYTVIDYMYATADSFDHPARLECRGIKFAPDGSILARPFHKFFNVNEKPETQAGVLDFSQPHVVMEKVDGSMIHPAIVNGELVFMTRMGRTDHAVKAERHLTPQLRQELTLLVGFGWTPIFEWTAPDNRIVVRYEDSRLTLLAIRHNETGQYMQHGELRLYASEFGVPCVTVHPSTWPTASEFVDYARAVVGSEGFVVRFSDGTMVKAKGEDYVLKHRAKDSILQEKNIMALVLSGGLDDVLPLLDAPDAEAAEAYRDVLLAGIDRTAAELLAVVSANDNLSQKEFALGPVKELPVGLRALAFQVRSGTDAALAVRTCLIARATSQTSVDETRHLHGARWAA